MSKKYIAVIGIYNEFTTEQVIIKETGVNASDEYEAHKLALFKCKDDQIVFRILEPYTKAVLFDFQKGFNP